MTDARKEKDVVLELCQLIISKNYKNFKNFVVDVIENYSHEHFNAIKRNEAMFERLIDDNYLEYLDKPESKDEEG